MLGCQNVLLENRYLFDSQEKVLPENRDIASWKIPICLVKCLEKFVQIWNLNTKSPGKIQVFVEEKNRYFPNFFGGCFRSSHQPIFTEQIPIFQEDMSVHRTDTDFQGALFIWLPNRYRFSRKPFLNKNEQIVAIGLSECFLSLPWV